MTVFSSKNHPDVVELGSDWLAQFSSAGVLDIISMDSVDFSRFLDFSLPPAR
jgi:hypothetical protein